MWMQRNRLSLSLLMLVMLAQSGCLIAAAGFVGYKASEKNKGASPSAKNNKPQSTTPAPPTNTTSGKSYPRVIISIPEYHASSKERASDAAVETEFTKLFINQGFKLVDKQQGEKAWKDEVLYKLDKEEDIKAAAALAFKLGAEVLVIGQAFSEKVGGGGIVVNMNARTDIKVIRADTGEIIWADSQTSRATDSTEMIASKKALAKSGQELAPKISAKIISLDYKKLGSRIEIVLAYPSGKLSLSDVKKFKDGLKEVKGVKEIIDREFNAGAALMDVVFQGSANDFAEAIDEKAVGARVCSINKVSAGKVFVDLK